MAELEPLKNIVDNVIMMRAGLLGVTIIRKRVRDGKFLEGSSEGAESYSTKTFAMPFGALSNALQTKAKSKQGPNAFQIFTSKNGNLWVAVQGGYKHLRSAAGKKTDKVTLTWSGRMMRNLNVLPDGVTRTSAILGFTDETSKRLASYHNDEGAGKSKRKHVFMNFTEADKAKLVDLIGDELAKKLVRFNNSK